MRPSRKLLTALLLTSISAVGCSSTPGSPLGFSPPQHKLIKEAREFREAAGNPDGPRELAKSLLPAYVVEPGDVLLVQPADIDSPIRLPVDQPILPDGSIDLGKYGRPVVAGKTLPDIEVQIKDAVRADVTVRLISRVSKVFYVLGEVNAPGAFPIAGRETALDAIIIAGGITRRANEKAIILSRPSAPCNCRTVMPICYPRIVQLGDTTTNYQLLPGDRIYVPSKRWYDDLCKRFHKDCDPCSKPQKPCCLPQTLCGSRGRACATCGEGPMMPPPEVHMTVSELPFAPPELTRR
ncbi:MAG: polysaccharide biosynthesis/export family protein [Gemmataceae bacterium]